MTLGRPLLVTLFAAGTAAAALAACHSVSDPRPEQQTPAATLASDSTEYAVRLENGLYRANIGYTYVNRSGETVSTNFCRTPPPPALEKNVDGRWVRAYSPIELLCLHLPPFRVADGESYRGAIVLAVAPPGSGNFPKLEVPSVSGTYRLRWALRKGANADDGAPLVEAVSNEFLLVER